MTLVAVKPSIEDVLEHHGVRGMKWGVRRAPSSSGSSSGASPPKKIITKKRVIKASAILVGVGAGVAIAVLAKNGPSLRSSPEFKKTATRGAKAAKSINNDAWNKSVRDMMADINSAHEVQTQNMRRTMAGMGANYNPRANPFTPEARRLRLT